MRRVPKFCDGSFQVGSFCLKHAGNLVKHPCSSLATYRFCGCHRSLHHKNVNAARYLEHKNVYGKKYTLDHSDGQWMEKVAMESEARDFCENEEYADLWMKMAVWFAVFNDRGTVSRDKFEYMIRRFVQKSSERKRTILFAKRHGWLRKLEVLLEKGHLVWYYTKCRNVLDETNLERREELNKKALELKKYAAMTFKNKLKLIERQQALTNLGGFGNFAKYRKSNAIDINLRSKDTVYGVGLKVKPSHRELRQMLEKYSTPCRLTNGGYVSASHVSQQRTKNPPALPST